MNSSKQFEKFARDFNVSSLNMHNYKNLIQKKAHTISPMVIEERQMNASTISVFDRLMMDKIIFLGDEIDDFVANIINAQLLYLDSEVENLDDVDPIWLYINSPGGDCYSGLAIYDTCQIIKSPVYTTVIGLAASMAFILAISGEKKHRYALRHSRLMLHQPLGGVPYSQAADIEIYNKEMQEVKTDLIEIMAKHTGQSFEKIVEDCNRDYWMRGHKAVEYGAIDKILTKIIK